jgi:hypothetical protein
MAVLEAAIQAAAAAATETAVNEALDARYGHSKGGPAPAVSPEAAAAEVVDRLAVAHAHEVSAGEQDVTERLAARFGPEVVRDPRVMDAVDWVVRSDRGAHAAARVVVGRDLAEAYSAPAHEREGRAVKVLEAESARVRARAGTRMARATQSVLAAVRLPDEALDVP